MLLADALQQGRACFGRQAWREAYDLLSDADREAPLTPEDIDRLATCAFLLGDESGSADLWARAHQEFQKRGDVEQAALCAFRIGIGLFLKGQAAHANGWLSRARRLLDDAGLDCSVRGYLLMPEGIGAVRAGNPARAHELFCKAADIGRRFGDDDLVAIARQGTGRALIRMGQVAEGLALLDEVMVAVLAGELAPLHVGDIYCSVIDACTEIYDLRRAHEWTAALQRWCERQPDGLPYRGSWSRPTRRDHEAARVMDRCDGRGGAGVRAVARAATEAGGWAGVTTSAVSCTGCAASWKKRRRRTGRRPSWGRGRSRDLRYFG